MNTKLWYAIEEYDQERCSCVLGIPPDSSPEDKAAFVAHNFDTDLDDNEEITVVLYESETGPEIGWYRVVKKVKVLYEVVSSGEGE